MEKRSSASDSGGAAPCNTVFVDTSLDTHLALTVSDPDTVSDLKKKILYEHALCFPNIGEINIHALKVKRRGNYYHLSDSMFVKSVFNGICKSWFLSVDASRLQKHIENQHSGKPESGDIVTCFGITDNFLARGISYLTDGPTKRLSDVGDSSLPLVQRDWHAKEKLSVDINSDINCNFLSLDTNNRSDPDLQEKHELLDSNKYKDPIMRTGCEEDIYRNVISDTQFSVSLDEDPTTGSAAKKKHKTKRKRQDKSVDHALKENDASAPEPDKDVSQQDIVVPGNSLLNEDGVLTHNMVMERKTIADKPCQISSSDTNKSPGGEVLMTNVLYNGTAVPRNYVECEKENPMNDVLNVQCHVSLEEASPGPTKKKQKTLSSIDASEENRVLCNSTNDSSGPGISISQCLVVDKQKGMDVTVDHLSSEMLKDGHLLTNSSSTGKWKRKRKSSKVANQEVASVPNSAENDGIESAGNAVGDHYKDLERELVAPVVQDVIISEPCSISVKENLSVPVQEVGENKTVRRSLAVDMSDTDAGNAESTKDPPEAAPASAVKGMKDTDASNAERTKDPPEAAPASVVRGMKISHDRHTMEVEGNPPVFVQEGNDLKDSGVTVEPGKSSKKRKKSKKIQDPVTVKQVTSGTEVPPVAVQEGNDLSKDIGIEHGNVTVNDCQKFGSDQTVRVEEERVLSQHKDSKAMPSAMCTPFSRDEIDVNSKVVVQSDLLDRNDNVKPGKSKKRKKSAKCSPVSREEIDTNSIIEVTSNLLETNGIVEPGKSSKKKKKSKRTQDPSTVQQVTSGTEHMTCSVIGISSTDLHETVHNDHLIDSGEKEESKAKTVNAPILATARETENVIQNVLESLLDLSKNAENKVEKSRKKTKKKQSSGAKSIPELQTEDENVSCKNAKLATDGTRELEVDALSLAKTSSEHQLNGSNCKPGNNAGVETDPLHRQLNVKSTDEANIQGEVSCESERTIINDKFLPSQNQPEAVASGMVLVDKITKATKGPDNEVEAGKDQKKSHVRSNKIKETIAASNSSLESFKSTIPQSERVSRHQSQVAGRKKISNNVNGEVLNSSERKKSLLASSGTIFKFDSDRSSDDEDNSDTSTRTPSDNSSDYSDGDSSATQNGSYSPKRKEQRGRNISNSHSSLNLDTIIRSSSIYKAAKLSASQSQPLDFESQPPDDFVPESQPNP